jgi:hypothetical protein
VPELVLSSSAIFPPFWHKKKSLLHQQAATGVSPQIQVVEEF